ncbi:signal peptidase II [Spiroplasma endosymbiont of Polydrusus pterygomalis]|uniref:signal peptidase II n=1 Tax=Spiroplasma endosymbiont of Polydrusus pterygomalis TaxID=3139327 RepID=UPI003CCAE928
MEFSWLATKNHLKTRDWKWLTKIICFCAIIVLVVTDQMIKLAVQKEVKFDQEYPFLPGFINLKFIINYGSAFSLFQNQRIFLIIFAFISAIASIIWLLFTNSINRALGLSFVIAGILGNLIDRFLHEGGVVDFLLWQLFPPYTIFNTADIFITIGIITIILQIIISTIINAYQEKHGEHHHEVNNGTFTTVSNDRKTKENKNNISRNNRYPDRQIFSNSIKRASLFTKFYSKFNRE